MALLTLSRSAVVVATTETHRRDTHGLLGVCKEAHRDPPFAGFVPARRLDGVVRMRSAIGSVLRRPLALLPLPSPVASHVSARSGPVSRDRRASLALASSTARKSCDFLGRFLLFLVLRQEEGGFLVSGSFTLLM